MSMRSEILAVVDSTPRTAQDIIKRVHATGTRWKATSISQEVGRLASRGLIRNVDRHPKYGNIEHQPCRYEAVTS